jgi:hypothetical protein
MKTNDHLQANKEIKGIFYLKIIDKNGNVLEEYEDKNLIVDKARYNMSRLLGASGNNYYINTIGFGVGAVAPAVGDLGLTGGITKAISAVVYPDGVSVRFDWTLELNEGNGLAITEFGLISQNGDLFSRKTRAAINKANDFRIEGSWRILF